MGLDGSIRKVRDRLVIGRSRVRIPPRAPKPQVRVHISNLSVRLGLLLLGLAALLVGLGFAGAAVFPRLGVRSPRRWCAHAEYSLNIRQLHGQHPMELADQFVAQSDRERLEELAQQIVWLAQIVWTKNVWLQRSLLAAAAVLVLVAAYLA